MGVFMNYLGIGSSKDTEREEEATAGVDRSGDIGNGSILLDISSGKAEIPLTEDGRVPRVMLTEMNNIGEFVAAALDLEKWERDMNIVGSIIRLDELVRIAEEVRGKKFEVVKLEKKGLVEEHAALGEEQFVKQLWVEYKLLLTADKVGESFLDPVVNELCPGVKAVDVESYLKKYWGKSTE